MKKKVRMKGRNKEKKIKIKINIFSQSQWARFTIYFV